MTRIRARTHLVAVTLRSQTRKAVIPARLSRTLNQVRAVGKRFTDAPHTGVTDEIDLLVRRRILGHAAHQLATAIETALETTGEPSLETHLDALNTIGVNHHATAQDLATEAHTLTRHAREITYMAKQSPRIATVMADHLERNPC